MNHAEIWRQVARRLGVPQIAPRDRVYLEEEGHFEPSPLDSEEEREERVGGLVDALSRLWKRDRSGEDEEWTNSERVGLTASAERGARQCEPRPGMLAMLGDDEVARALAFSAYLASLASRHPWVCSFREEVFGAAGPSRAAGAALLGVVARSTGEKPVSPFQVLSLRAIRAAGSTELPLPTEPPGSDPIPERLYYRDPFREGEYVRRSCPVWPGSAFDDLRELAFRLTQAYPWDAAQAAWFVLSGLSPWVPPVECGVEVKTRWDHDSARITLNFDPLVSTDAIMRVVQTMRRDILGGSGNRRHSERSMRLYLFVLFQRDQSVRPTWGQITTWWNEVYPRWRFSQSADCCHAFQRAESYLTRKRYPWPALTDPGKAAEENNG